MASQVSIGLRLIPDFQEKNFPKKISQVVATVNTVKTRTKYLRKQERSE